MLKKNLDLNLKSTELVFFLETAINDEVILSSFVRNAQIMFLGTEEIHIGVAVPYAVTFLTENYTNVFVQGCVAVFNRPYKVRFFLKSEYQSNHRKKSVKTTIKKLQNTFLNPNFTFNNFVVTSFNKETFQAGKAVLLKPGTYNPLFIYSGSGLGKTHFLHGLGNTGVKKNLKCFYLTPNKLTTEVQQALAVKPNGIEKIKQKYVNADIILIDDVQFLAPRPKTLEILFEIINNAIENKNQTIVFTSDKAPEDLGGFEDRFVTRFASGLILPFAKPTAEDFNKVVKVKIHEFKVFKDYPWKQKAIDFITKNTANNIREIEAALSRVRFLVEMYPKGTPITYSVVEDMFQGVMVDKKLITPERIILVVGKYYNVSKRRICGHQRKQSYVVPRHVAMWLTRELCGLSYQKIGYAFGNRDHSTILNAIQKINYRKRVNQTVTVALNQLRKQIERIN